MNGMDPFSTFFQNDPFFSSPFGAVSSMMKRSDEMFRRMHEGMNRQINSMDDGNSMSFSSSITSVSTDGVTKTKKTVKDSRNGVEKVSIIKQVGDKKSIVEKTRDKEGREECSKRLEGVTEEDEFEKEWKQKSKDLPKVFKSSGSGYDLGSSESRSKPKALGYERKRY